LEKGKYWFFFAAAFEQTGARSSKFCVGTGNKQAIVLWLAG
jgi:hypothetical protein